LFYPIDYGDLQLLYTLLAKQILDKYNNIYKIDCEHIHVDHLYL